MPKIEKTPYTPSDVEIKSAEENLTVKEKMMSEERERDIEAEENLTETQKMMSEKRERVQTGIEKKGKTGFFTEKVEDDDEEHLTKTFVFAGEINGHKLEIKQRTIYKSKGDYIFGRADNYDSKKEISAATIDGLELKEEDAQRILEKYKYLKHDIDWEEKKLKEVDGELEEYSDYKQKVKDIL